MGLVFLFSASQGNIETTIKQSFFVLFGLILMFAVSQPDPDFYKNNSLLFFLIVFNWSKIILNYVTNDVPIPRMYFPYIPKNN